MLCMEEENMHINIKLVILAILACTYLDVGIHERFSVGP